MEFPAPPKSAVALLALGVLLFGWAFWQTVFYLTAHLHVVWK